MEKDASPASESTLANSTGSVTTNSQSLPRRSSTESICFDFLRKYPENPFGANFASMYRSIFPPKSPVLSLSPSTSSSTEDQLYHNLTFDVHATENRLNQARLILEFDQLRDHYDLCRAELQDVMDEIQFLSRENDFLRLANTKLVRYLSSQAAMQNLLNHSSSQQKASLLNALRRLNNGVNAGDEISVVSPTSVIERSSPDRLTLPKSISVRSTGYLKPNQIQSRPSRSAPSPQTPSHLASKSQTVYVPPAGATEKKEEPVEVEVYNQGMFKTELCNKWQATGTCPYTGNCRFAHGIHELRPVIRHPRYKTQVCRMVLTGDTCPYGHRCHFRHSLTELERASSRCQN